MNLVKNRIPSVFISSTCYDLRQIRKDIKDFITGLGYEAILSEFNSFPIDPNLNTVDNCVSIVKERAELFVLIIGGRYGSESENGKSITNLEYIYARAKGIPIFVFIQNSVMDIIKLWKDNPQMNFKSYVDSTKVFEFIETIRNIEKTWVFGFGNAQDICDTLRDQFAYLFYNNLRLGLELQDSKLSSRLQKLDSASLKIAIEKPRGWEYLLFGSVLEYGIKDLANLRRDYNLGISYCSIKEFTDITEAISWIGKKSTHLSKITDVMSKLFNQEIQEAFGADGVPGDAEHIVYVAEKVVEVYKEVMNWSLEIKSSIFPDIMQRLMDIFATFSNSIVLPLEEYYERYNKDLAEALEYTKNGEMAALDLKLKIAEIKNLQEFTEELQNLQKHVGLI